MPFYAPYSDYTLAQARADLAARLSDPSHVFWSADDLDACLREAMRAWGAYAEYWRARGTITAAAGTTWVALPASLTDSTTYLRAEAVTDRDLVVEAERHLLEAPTSSWPGASLTTDQFTLSQLSGALRDSLNDLIRLGGLNLRRTEQAAPLAPASRADLPTTTVDVRRLAWKPVDGSYRPLHRLDEEAAFVNYPGWQQRPGRPYAYSIAVSPLTQAQLIPPPLDTGSLGLVAVTSVASLDPTASATALPVPQDLSWAVKYGALARLLNADGQGDDPDRAAYCQQRFSDGVQLARQATVVCRAQLNGVDMNVSTPAEMDRFRPTWESSTGTPSTLLVAGLNLVALSPTPTEDASLTLDVVANAPFPASDADYLQVGREYVSTVLDYAQHCASFKLGGQEWASTQPLFRGFLEAAAAYNARLRANARYFHLLSDKSRRDFGRERQYDENGQ